jgi:hypothetical protein
VKQEAEGKCKKCAAYFAALKMEKAGSSEKFYLSSMAYSSSLKI